MDKWKKLADKDTVQKTIEALKSNGIDALFVENGEQAAEKVRELLPQGAEVMNMTSVSLSTIGIADDIVESGKYTSVRKKLTGMDRKIQALKMQKMGAAPEWVVGSVNAITKNGQLMIASASGSQLPAYVNGSAHVIWVVGAQKIVKNIDEGMKRIYEYCLPLEDERAQKAYGISSAVNKIVIINKERPGRISLILVNEVLGF